MQQLPFRAIVSDLDGTLLTPNHTVGEFTIDTLQKLAAKGVDIMLATGRSYYDVKEILSARIGIANAIMITSNGAKVHNLQGELLLDNPLPDALAYEITNVPFDPSKVCVNTYQNAEWFVNVDIPEMKDFHKDSGFCYQVTNFKTLQPRDTEKVFFLSRKPQDLVSVEQHIQQHFGEQVNMAYSTPTCLEIMYKNVSKATALAQVVAHKNYALADCIAFGDGMNDVEMLSEVGKGLIMGNADPRLSQAAPQLEIIGRNAHESVASYLRATFGIC